MARKKEFDPEKALDKAMHIFWLKGYIATSVDDLCSAMGIKRGSLYPTFGDKHTLFMKSLNHYIELMYQNSEPATKPESALEAIEGMFQFIVDEAVNDDQRRGCFLVNSITELASLDPEVAKLAQDQRTKLETGFYDFLVQAENKGEISKNQNLRAKAQFLVNALMGLRVTGKIIPDRIRLENIVAETLSTLY